MDEETAKKVLDFFNQNNQTYKDILAIVGGGMINEGLNKYETTLMISGEIMHFEITKNKMLKVNELFSGIGSQTSVLNRLQGIARRGEKRICPFPFPLLFIKEALDEI